MQKIYIAMHKPYAVPKDALYVPLQVGAEGKKPFCAARDNEGENISEKNPGYCELTGLYWLRYHADADVVGLVHYRRYFVRRHWRFYQGEKRCCQRSGITGLKRPTRITRTLIMRVT